MPRTKLTKTINKSDSMHTMSRMDKTCEEQDLTTLRLNDFNRLVKNKQLELKTFYDRTLDSLYAISYGELALFSEETANKTLGELRKEKSMSMFFDSTSILKHFNSTENNTFAAGKKKKHIEDEAAESVSKSMRSASGDRAPRNSRAQQRPLASKQRTSRSLSRTKMPKNVTIQAPKNEKTTPKDRRMPPPNFGYVTPKVKPNTPLAMLRRPKQGEMAISMQGSPLMVSGVVTETCANVNIPLADGRIMSLQPSRDIRMSQIPNLDDETRQQLAMLRDNLNKVVRMANNL